MKIISKFKDYYDSAAGFGIDDTIMYVRTQKEIVLRTSLLSIPKVNHENSFGGYRVRPAFKSFFGEPIKYEGSFYLTGCLIGIAGQIFVCLKVTHRQDERKYKYLHFTAFNNIAGFISGVLGSKEHEMVHINDKDMLVAKGFDQWSFRTMKSKKS
jgi:hypothetical protein